MIDYITPQERVSNKRKINIVSNIIFYLASVAFTYYFFIQITSLEVIK